MPKNPNEFLPFLQFLWAVSKNLVKETSLTTPEESEELDHLVSVVTTRYLTDQRRSLLSDDEQHEVANEDNATAVKKNKDKNKKRKKMKKQKIDMNKSKPDKKPQANRIKQFIIGCKTR